MICLFILTSFSQGGVSVNCHGLRESRDRVVIRNPSSNKQICFDVTWHSQIRAKYNTRRNAKEQPGSAMAEGKRDDLHLTSTGRGHAFRNSLQFPPLDFKVLFVFRTQEGTSHSSQIKTARRNNANFF